jgi:protein-L-isoaspartate(D-aspartate) O-methyltransferase
MIDDTAEEERTNLVRALRVHDERVRKAMLRVERHRFVPSSQRPVAYEDEPVPLGPPGATASAPHMVVLLVEALDPAEGDHLLEIGGGMGYLAAVLAEVVGPRGHVDTIELDPWLASEATRRLGETGEGSTVSVWCRDGRAGLPERAPFHGIVISCAIDRLPTDLAAQLRDGGRLVAPVGGEHEQKLLTYTRHGPGGTTIAGVRCRFVPMKRAEPSHI